ncbi:hypothetical protein J3F83DRAFT_251432 [Trichoderma novae-zelandiae]
MMSCRNVFSKKTECRKDRSSRCNANCSTKSKGVRISAFGTFSSEVRQGCIDHQEVLPPWRGLLPQVKRSSGWRRSLDIAPHDVCHHATAAASVMPSWSRKAGLYEGKGRSCRYRRIQRIPDGCSQARLVDPRCERWGSSRGVVNCGGNRLRCRINRGLSASHPTTMQLDRPLTTAMVTWPSRGYYPQSKEALSKLLPDGTVPSRGGQGVIGRAKFVAAAWSTNQPDRRMHPDSSSSLVATDRLHHH